MRVVAQYVTDVFLRAAEARLSPTKGAILFVLRQFHHVLSNNNQQYHGGGKISDVYGFEARNGL
jgi:hypothetical protein